MEKQIIEIYNSLQEIAWHFGSHGINGECCEDLTFIEFMALKNICENPDISVQELGVNLKITKSGATKIINRLEKKDYVTRKTSPLDGRVCCVCANDRGDEVLTRIITKYTSHIDEMFKHKKPNKLQEINSVLKLIIDSINESENASKG